MGLNIPRFEFNPNILKCTTIEDLLPKLHTPTYEKKLQNFSQTTVIFSILFNIALLVILR